MQYFFYNCIKHKYSDKAEMLLTDTDSRMYKIKAENVYRDFYKDSYLTSVITEKIQNITILQIT